MVFICSSYFTAASGGERLVTDAWALQSDCWTQTLTLTVLAVNVSTYLHVLRLSLLTCEMGTVTAPVPWGHSQY